MIITPRYHNDLKNEERKTNSLGFSQGYDSEGDKVFQKKRYLRDGLGNIRSETLNIYPKTNTLVKESVYGYMSHKDIITPRSFMYVTIDLKTGKNELWGSYTDFPSVDGYANSTQFAGTFNFPPPSQYVLSDNNPILFSTAIESCVINRHDSTAIKMEISGFEDIFDMEYGDCIGLLKTFFSQWAFTYPFECIVTIDSKKGFNVTNFVYLKGILDDDAVARLYGCFCKEVDTITSAFKRICDRNKRHIRVRVGLSPFVQVMRVKDMRFPERSIAIQNSSSEHFNNLIYDGIADNSYIFKESFYHIVNNDLVGEITDEMCQLSIPATQDF